MFRANYSRRKTALWLSAKNTQGSTATIFEPRRDVLRELEGNLQKGTTHPRRSARASLSPSKVADRWPAGAWACVGSIHPGTKSDTHQRC